MAPREEEEEEEEDEDEEGEEEGEEDRVEDDRKLASMITNCMRVSEQVFR